MGPNKCPLYGIAGCPNILKSEIQFGHSELSVILEVSAVEGCPLSGVPLCIIIMTSLRASSNYNGFVFVSPSYQVSYLP